MKIWDWVFAALCAVWAFAMLLSTAPPAIKAVLSAPDASVTAAWAQALLSAAAILISGLVAIGLTAWQHSQQQRLHQRLFVEAQLQKLAGLSAIFGSANQLFKQAVVIEEDGYEGYLLKTFRKDKFDDVVEMLGSVPLHDLGNPGVTKAVIDLKRAVSDAGARLMRAKARIGVDMNPLVEDPVAEPREIAIESIATLDRTLRDVQTSLCLLT